jgi:hypothetical protein
MWWQREKSLLHPCQESNPNHPAHSPVTKLTELHGSKLHMCQHCIYSFIANPKRLNIIILSLRKSASTKIPSLFLITQPVPKLSFLVPLPWQNNYFPLSRLLHQGTGNATYLT